MKLEYTNSDIYGNCRVLSPDNILMFLCNHKRIKWYLDKNLAEVIKGDVTTIRLTFEPKGLGNHNKDFGLSEIVNRCVVCGSEDFLTRHHVVPQCYKKNFPVEVKSHNFHDVLSMCVNCHDNYERFADTLKVKLSVKYNSPIHGEIIDNRELSKYGRIASVLLDDNLKLPKNVRFNMISKIKKRFSIKRLTNKRIIKLSTEFKNNICLKSHGEIVIEQITDIQSFVEMWRNHFIQSMDCKYLPENWNVKSIIYNK